MVQILRIFNRSNYNHMNFSLLVDDYYILGDSLSDVNNFVSFTEGFLPTTPLFFPGQFTNGTVNENGQPIPNAQGQTEGVWVEYFTQELDLEFSSFYQDRNNIDTTKDGINFAIGAATSGDANIGLSFPDDENGPGLREQLNDLTATVDSLEDDLVFVWVGANDYLGAVNTFSESIDVETLATQVVETNISGTLTTLLDRGAEILVVPNLSDLQKTPFGKDNPILTELTETHNQLLANTLDNLRHDYPDAKIISVDINTFFEETSVTFSNREEPVTGTDLYNGVFDAGLLGEGIPGYKTASDTANDTLWWDSVHPTTAAHAKIADYILETIESELVIAGSDGKDELIGKNGKEYILGLNGKDKIVGGTGDDLIDGGSGKDRLFGEEGDDTFIGGTGKDLIDGGTGTDTAVYDGSIDNFTFNGTADNFQVQGMDLGTDTLIDVEFLKFQDGVFATSDLLEV